MDVPKKLFDQANLTLLRECFEGPPERGTWVISNEPGSALLPTLEQLDVRAASARSEEHPSVAAHVNHLRYAMSLANRWAEGENPYTDADWAGSWSKQVVNEEEWTRLRDDLRREYQRWSQAVVRERPWAEESVTGPIALVAHCMYHLGAIRQRVAAVTNAQPAEGAR